MKRLISLLLPLAAIALGSCSKIDYNLDIESYNDNIFFVSNTMTGENYVSTHGKIGISGDISTQTYTLKINDVQLTENSPLLSGKVYNLLQLYLPKGESEEEKYLPLYFYFKQDTYSKTGGDLDIASMKYGYLTGTYWLSFFANNNYSVWSTPRVRTLYALKNIINTPMYPSGPLTENTLEPSYKFTIDMTNRTVSIKAQGVKFPQDIHDIKQTLSFQSFELTDIPIDFSASGYSFFVPELIPVINGKAAPEHAISELYGEIAFDYDGKKLMTYKMKNQNGDNISVESTLGLAKAYR